MNKVTVVILSVVAIFIFLIAAYKFTGSAPSDQAFPEINKISASDYVKWSADKKNILVEYSDLQCPACRSFAEFMKSEIEASGAANADIMKKVTFVYRHFPLLQHDQALIAAYSSEAAGKQAKFYEFLDIAFAKQDEWAGKKDAKEKFESYAKTLKLDLNKFRKDRDSKEIKDKVDADLLSGQQAEVNATPTFYLNGKKMASINSFEDFLKPLKELK